MSAAYEALVVGLSPIVFYTLDEASSPFADSGAADLDAVELGTGNTYQQEGIGPNSYSMTLNGSGYLSVADDAAFAFTTNLSLMAWIKYTSVNQFKQIIGRNDATASYQFYMYVDTGHKILGAIRTTGSYGINSAYLGPSLNDDKWHQVAITWDGTWGRAYVDGIKIGDSSVPNTIATSSMALTIGDVIGSAGDWGFPGSIAYPAVWNTTLTDSQIYQLFFEGRGRLPDEVRNPRLQVNLHNRYFL